MSTLPRISIVTPCLNMGRYIEDAIRSVQEQGYSNCEHVIIDAVSNDNTTEIVRRYPHVCFISEPDRGQSDGLNKGFRIASGDIVGWLNADEYYLPGAFHAVQQTFQAHPEADVVYGDGITVNESAQLIRSKPAHRFDYRILLYYGCFIGTLGTFFRRTIFEQGHFIDPDYRVVMDFEYFVRLGALGKKFSYIPSLLGAFRWTGHNASLQSKKRREERLRVQRTWSRLKLPNVGYDALSEVYRAKRIALKLLNGNYRRELRILSHSGEPTDWFHGGRARGVCESLINDYLGPRQAAQLSSVAAR